MSFEAARVGARTGGGGGGFGARGGGGFGGGGGYQNPPYDNRSVGMSPTGSGGGETAFDDAVRQVQAGIRALSAAVGEIERLTGQLGSFGDTQQLREDLRARVASAQHGAKSTTEKLRALDGTVRQSGDPQRRMTQQKLMKDFQDWLHRYQDVSQLSAEKERQFQPQSQSAGGDGGRAFGGGYASDDLDPEEVAAREEERLRLVQHTDFNAAIIEERERGIREIERTVQDVNDIFVDLGKLVTEQGAMIDNIESNIEDTVVHVDAGVGELRKASTHQKKARSKACCLALIILILAGAIVGFVFLFKAT